MYITKKWSTENSLDWYQMSSEYWFVMDAFWMPMWSAMLNTLLPQREHFTRSMIKEVYTYMSIWYMLVSSIHFLLCNRNTGYLKGELKSGLVCLVAWYVDVMKIMKNQHLLLDQECHPGPDKECVNLYLFNLLGLGHTLLHIIIKRQLHCLAKGDCYMSSS